MPVNFEFKARCEDIEMLEKRLLERSPVFIGTDRQVDTYFNVNHGRLKLREGNIENALIHYTRDNTAAAKQSEVLLYNAKPGTHLKDILVRSLGIMTIVDKTRKIYFVDNVKFHFDQVIELGSFVEVEAIDADGSIGTEKLREQCNVYAHLFGIGENDFIADSYSDMLLAKKSSTV